MAATAISTLYAGTARAGYIEAGPQTLAQTRSLADLIATKKKVHIVYVHGMRAEGPGAAHDLLRLLRTKLSFTDMPAPVRTTLHIGDYPAGARVAGQPIWESTADWDASQPFVDHYWLRGPDGVEVNVDEVNWWPLLFPLKCKALIVPEHDLSGDDREHLKLCGSGDAPFHNWISPAEAGELAKPQRGHAALINKVLKHQIMNWGISDAVIVSGPMRLYLNEAMHQAFSLARSEADGNDEAYVVMSESLGCFVVMDAMTVSGAVQDVLDRTDDLYFFANQFALLELGRISGIPAASAPSAPDAFTPREATAGAPMQIADIVARTPASPIEVLQGWASRGRMLVDRPRQIIAFSDPSDLLTYPIPNLDHVKVVNIYDRNATRWLWLLANPIEAHTGHLRNRTVWNILTRRTTDVGSATTP